MTIRATLKSIVTGLGLYPAFCAGRRVYQRNREFISLLPLKILIGFLGRGYVALMWTLRPNWRWVRDYVPKFLESYRSRVTGGGDTFIYHTPNSICQYRAETLFTKEPETLEWIDSFGKYSVLCDIGANVGMYTIYHAVKNQGTVYACEPSFFNLPCLVKNINANNVQTLVTVFPLPLTSQVLPSAFKLSSTDEGGALSAFDVSYGHTGQPLATSISYRVTGVSLDYLIEQKLMDKVPNLIKLDVDGIEHLILAGAKNTLKHPDCKSVLVEIDERFGMQYENVYATMKECGFVLQAKKRAPMFAHLVENGRDIGCYNHIFVRPPTA
jgi:FkbM family methyltransferase